MCLNVISDTFDPLIVTDYDILEMVDFKKHTASWKKMFESKKKVYDYCTNWQNIPILRCTRTVDRKLEVRHFAWRLVHDAKIN